MDIEWSKMYFAKISEWVIDDSSFQVIDEDEVVWIAKVETNNEQSLTVLVHGIQHFVLEDAHLPVLLDWCLRQVRQP